MHIHVQANYNFWAEELRKNRNESNIALEQLALKWASLKPSLAGAMRNEIRSIPFAKLESLKRSEEGKKSADLDTAVNARHAPIQQEIAEILRIFREYGSFTDATGQNVRDFWESNIHKDLPHLQISAHLFARVAHRVASGQRVRMVEGLLNDIRAISSYAPYVDAMFVDKTCAELLSKRPADNSLNFKARIFSLADTQEFLAFLDEIELTTPYEVKELASRLYGIEDVNKKCS